MSLIARKLPKGLRCFSLDLKGAAITELPDDLQVEFKLNLTDCASLEALPRGLKTGSLVLTRCTGLRALPEDLEVNFLTLDGCTALRDWPESARVHIGALSARGCASLAGLPSSLGNLTNLDLRGCRKIGALPRELKLSGGLDLADTGIEGLPESLKEARLRWRGVAINAQIAFFPETLTVAEILGEGNAEVRRVMLERYGIEKFMANAGAKVLDEDRDAGGDRRLLKVPLTGDEDLVCVSIRCPSTERHYLVRVPPTMASCRQAAAWMAGFDNPDDYNPIVET